MGACFATDQYRIQIATDDQFTNIELEKLVFRKDTTITLIGSVTIMSESEQRTAREIVNGQQQHIFKL